MILLTKLRVLQSIHSLHYGLASLSETTLVVSWVRRLVLYGQYNSIFLEFLRHVRTEYAIPIIGSYSSLSTTVQQYLSQYFYIY